MKKILFSLLTFFILFALIGCGDGGNTPVISGTGTGDDGTQKTGTAIAMKENYIVVDQNKIDFKLPITIIKKIDKSYLVELSKLELNVIGCELATVTFDPSKVILAGDYNTVTTVNVTGAFAEPCTDLGYTFKAIQVATKGNNIETITIDSTFDYGNLGDLVDSSNYSLSAVPSTINISTADTSRVLDLYLTDTSAKEPVVGQSITAQFVDPNNGTLNQYTGMTDATGHVSFKYTRPETFTVGNSFDIIFNVAGGTVPKNATVSVTFVTVDFDYTLINATTPLLISYATQEKDISVYLVDNDNVGIGGKTLSIAAIPDGYGSISSSTTETDASGKATFAYTAPDDITDLVGTRTATTLSFTEFDTTISQDVTIIISSAANLSDYSLVNPAPTVDINESNQGAVLDIQLIHTVNGNSIPVINAIPCITTTNIVTADCVIPEAIPREYGRIKNAAGSNEGDGYIYFDYEGPDANEAASGEYSFDVYYLNDKGEISSTNQFSVNIQIP